MKYANHISEIINAFSPEPLKAEQMEQFYCGDTMEYRMSDKYSSPIEDIFDACQEAWDYNAFLLLGHRGCGKSTELNRMSSELIEKGYKVKTIACSRDLDLFNIVYTDLCILIGEALLQIAKEAECEIDKEILNDITNFWYEITEITAFQETGATSVETGISVEMPKILSNVLNLFAKIKSDLKFNEETRTEYRRTIMVRSSEWLKLLGCISEEITKKLNGRKPIIIFEDLDKLNPADAWKIFYNYVSILSGMSFPVIYTFPIGLSYDPKFSVMESYFVAKTLPMIKIETIEGVAYEKGIQAIRKIVEKRAKLELFDAGVLEYLIQYTGGSLRDLFYTIHVSSRRAKRRESNSISMEDALRALEELKTSLTRRIEKKDYKLLLNIYNGNKELIEDKEKLLNMLQASVVLEYNGKRWHNLHPLIVQFFKEQGMISGERM